MKVSSSAIRDLEYDANAKTLTVEFTHGGRYRYQGVPEETYNKVMSSSSIGGSFQQLIRTQFPATKLK